MLIRAVATAKEQISNPALWIVGDGRSRGELERLPQNYSFLTEPHFGDNNGQVAILQQPTSSPRL